MLRLKSRQWLVDEEDRIIMGEGRMQILEHIDRTGSLNQTAKLMKMSYKGVWSKVKATEAYLKVTLVDTDRKTGSRLTPAGRQLLQEYRALKQQCLALENRCFEKIFGKMVRGLGGLASSRVGPPILLVVGFSNAGKTTLMEKLILELTSRGYRVGTIKHDVHGFEMDRPGKDSWRHKQAGASISLISSPNQIGVVLDADHDHEPDELRNFFVGANIILTEGFKRLAYPKVEVFRDLGYEEPLCKEDPHLLALVTDLSPNVSVPCFSTRDVEGLAAFIETSFHLADDVCEALSPDTGNSGLQDLSSSSHGQA